MDRVGFIKEDVMAVAAAITPMVNMAAAGINENMAYQIFFRSFEALQDFVGNDRAEARQRARYVSETIYVAADYSVDTGPKFKKVLNSNIDKMGIEAGQKGAQSSVEHSMPRKIIWNNLIKLVKAYGRDLTVEEVGDYIFDNNEIVVLTYEEVKILDSLYKLSSPDWNDKFARYKAVGINIVDAQTGIEVA